MSKRLINVLAIVVLAAQTLMAQTAMSDMATINKTLADLLIAYGDRNMAAIAGLMAADVQAFGSNFTAKGVEEFKQKAAPALAMVRGARPASGQDLSMSGNIAYVAFLVDTDRQTAADAPVTTTRVRWTVIFERRNSKWVVTHFHLSPQPQ